MENKISDVLRKQDENERLNEMFANAVGSEDAALREEHIKVFNLGGNRHQAVIYPEPVHFRDPKTGKWQDIDNTLEETVTAIGRRMLRNHAGRVRMEFPVQYINSAGKAGDVFVVGAGAVLCPWPAVPAILSRRWSSALKRAAPFLTASSESSARLASAGSSAAGRFLLRATMTAC